MVARRAGLTRGQTAVWFTVILVLGYLWSTWLLEHLRAEPHDLTGWWVGSGQP